MEIRRDLSRADSYTLNTFEPGVVTFTADEVYTDKVSIVLDDDEIVQLIKDLKQMRKQIKHGRGIY